MFGLDSKNPNSMISDLADDYCMPLGDASISHSGGLPELFAVPKLPNDGPTLSTGVSPSGWNDTSPRDAKVVEWESTPPHDGKGGINPSDVSNEPVQLDTLFDKSFEPEFDEVKPEALDSLLTIRDEQSVLSTDSLVKFKYALATNKRIAPLTLLGPASKRSRVSVAIPAQSLAAAQVHGSPGNAEGAAPLVVKPQDEAPKTDLFLYFASRVVDRTLLI